MTERETARARDLTLSGDLARGARAPIRASWVRARQRGLRPDGYLPPVPLADDAVERYRETHPLAAVWPVLLDSLRWAIAEPGSLLFLSDAKGHLLWVRGARQTMRVAERAHLAPGALWSEDTAGTSGVGTALALRRPFQVFGSEHFLSVATGFTCTAVPIQDPVTGELLGAIDLTCAGNERTPHVLSLLATAARLAESELLNRRLRDLAGIQRRFADRLARCGGVRAALVDADGVVVQASPDGWLPRRIAPLSEGDHVLEDGRAVRVDRLAPTGPFLVVERGTSGDVVALRALGRPRALLTVGGVAQELSRRHSELVTVLLANPGGLAAGELARAVHGADGKPATVRAELARLRAVLGHRLVSEPYRITGDCTADFLALEDKLGTSAAGELLDGYPGPLLPGSRAPGVAALRDRLHRRLDARLQASADPDARARWWALAGR